MIYVASSWRNTDYDGVIVLLKDAGYDVYDFRHPAPRERGLSLA